MADDIVGEAAVREVGAEKKMPGTHAEEDGRPEKTKRCQANSYGEGMRYEISVTGILVGEGAGGFEDDWLLLAAQNCNMGGLRLGRWSIRWVRACSVDGDDLAMRQGCLSHFAEEGITAWRKIPSFGLLLFAELFRDVDVELEGGCYLVAAVTRRATRSAPMAWDCSPREAGTMRRESRCCCLPVRVL